MFELPVQKQKDIVFVYIPSQYIPEKIKKKTFKSIKLKKPYEYRTYTYIYGGGGITRNNVFIPRTGISGNIKEAIPTDMKLTHIFKRGRWIPITEEPLLYPVKWSATRWRANIPISIRIKYAVQPYEMVRVTYSEYITDFVPAYTGEITIYHHGYAYKIQLDRAGGATWVIPKETLCHQALSTGLDMNVACNVQLEDAMQKDMMIAEFIFSKVGGKAVAKRNQIAYRTMVVKNYSSVKIDKSDYPELMEIRCSYLTSCPMEYYLPFKTKLETALEMSVNNILSFFIPGLKTGYNKGEKILKQISLNRYLKDKTVIKKVMEEKGYEGVILEETTGYIDSLDIEKSRIEYNKVAPFAFYTAEKYIRIKKGSLEYEYYNDDIDLIVNKKILNDGSMVYVDKQRFIWKTKI